jgi:hypothetical protein
MLFSLIFFLLSPVQLRPDEEKESVLIILSCGKVVVSL